ncbi:MAG: hypothetical protein GY717_19230, partial [Rhodobacteraceae bacterium]|nr:hypothetical protein [Paracoccaceae bacterium]
TTLNFGSGTHDLTAASSVTGAGDLVNSGGTLNVDGSFNLTGAVTASGGSLNLRHTDLSDLNLAGVTVTGGASFTLTPTQATGAALGPVAVSGTLTLNTTTADADGLTLSSSALGGSATLTVSGLTNWTSGTFGTGGGKTIAAGGLNISGISPKTIDDYTLESPGAGAWSGTGAVRMYAGSVFENSNTLDIQDNVYMGTWSGAPIFNNSGTLRRSAGAGTATLGVAFNNTGLVDVDTGMLLLAQSAAGVNDGVIDIANGATFQLTGGGSYTNNTGGGVIQGNGTLDVSTITFTNAGIIAPGASPGTLIINGDLNL